MKKRSQYSFEYIAVIGFGMALLLSIGVVYFTQVKEVTDDEQLTRVQIMTNDIIATANNVYYAGSISKKTLRYTMPSIVDSIDVKEDNSLVFQITAEGSTYDMVYYADIPIQGFFPDEATYGEKQTKIYTQQITHFLIYNCVDSVLICTEEFGCNQEGDQGCSS